MKRLFFALWPEQSTRQQCVNVITKFNCVGRPMALTNLHVTLLFLGRITSKQQASLVKEAVQLRTSPARLTFDHLSFWKKPAVLCLTTNRTDQHILQLNQQLTAIAKQHQINIDERPFKPHITLIKKVHQPIHIDFEPVFWRSDGFCLVESRSTDNGVDYEILEHWPSTNPLAS